MTAADKGRPVVSQHLVLSDNEHKLSPVVPRVSCVSCVVRLPLTLPNNPILRINVTDE